MSAPGTKLPIRGVCYPVATGDKPDIARKARFGRDWPWAAFTLADSSSIVGSYVRMVHRSRGRTASCGERDPANCRYANGVHRGPLL